MSKILITDAKGIGYCTTKAAKLMNANRFDIAAKTLYARSYFKGVESSFGERIYLEHLKVWNNFREKVPHKEGPLAFINSFQRLLKNIDNNGFEPETSRIPIKNNSALNGAHRIAGCIVLDKEIQTYEGELNEGQLICNYEYLKHKKNFVQSGLQELFLDEMALEFCRIKNNVYTITLFPSHHFSYATLLAMIREKYGIIYRKRITLTNTGMFNYIHNLYYGESWIGPKESNYPGVTAKASLCFSLGSTVEVLLVEEDNVEELFKLKQELRLRCGVSNHSVHINDTQEETWRIASSVYNKNSVHCLNNRKWISTNNFDFYFKKYKEMLPTTDNSEDFCLDPKTSMAAYGLEDCQNKGFSFHNTLKDEIIYNPNNHFYLHGIKFACPSVVRNLKFKKDDHKKIDIKLGPQENISVLILWKDDQRIIEELGAIGHIHSATPVTITDRGKYNLLDQIHHGKSWWKINLIPETEKRIQDNKFMFYIFTGKNLYKKIKKWKYETRNKLNIDKTYFHISDPDCYKHLGQQCDCPISSDEYNTESIRHINMIFHKNTFDFINQRTIKSLPQFDKCLELYRNWLPDNHYGFCVDNGGVLGAYGIRDTHDIDFLCHNDDIQTDSIDFGCENKNHRLEYKRMGYSIEDIINNPDNYFYHYGIKFMALSILKKFKFNRTQVIGEGQKKIREKDIKDYNLITNL